jgi:hypothetical protein
MARSDDASIIRIKRLWIIFMVQPNPHREVLQWMFPYRGANNMLTGKQLRSIYKAIPRPNDAGCHPDRQWWE